jgi:hypothetical protein
MRGWGDPWLPLSAVIRGGSLHRISLALASRGNHADGACRSAPMGTGDFGDESSYEWRFSLVLRRPSIRIPRLHKALVKRGGIHCQTHRFAAAALSGVPQPPPMRHARIRSRIRPLERVYRRSARPARYSQILSALCFWQLNAFLQSRHEHDLRVVRQSVTGERDYLVQRIFSVVTRLAPCVSRIERTSTKQTLIEQTFQESRNDGHPIVTRPAAPAENIRASKFYSQEMVLRRGSSEPIKQPEKVRSVAGEPAVIERELKIAQPRHSFSPVEFSPHDLQCLTDTVLRTLDHRILAKRERLGRA